MLAAPSRPSLSEIKAGKVMTINDHLRRDEARPTGDLMNLPVDLLARVISFPKKTGTASDAGSVMSSCPGPITPAWAGEMVATADAIQTAALNIRVLVYMFMVGALSCLSPLEADAPVLVDCLQPTLWENSHGQVLPS
jgi:hypothetical protein